MALFSDDDGTISRRSGLGEMDLDITPMIDVTFLLLIFFMVTSIMQKDQDAEIPYAEHGDGVSTQNAAIISISGREGTEPTIRVQTAGGGSQETLISGVRDFVEEERRAKHTHVIIKAGGQVPSGVVREVSEIVNGVEDMTFSIGVQDKPK
jgi:biopolymer transport protein ExbD